MNIHDRNTLVRACGVSPRTTEHDRKRLLAALAGHNMLCRDRAVEWDETLPTINRHVAPPLGMMRIKLALEKEIRLHRTTRNLPVSCNMKYEERPKFFALKYMRAMSKLGVVKDIGPSGVLMCHTVVLYEDISSYSRPATFWNHDLMVRLDIRQPKSFRAIRQRCCNAGWLEYEQGASRKPGKYRTVAPPELTNNPDAWARVSGMGGSRYPVLATLGGSRYPVSTTHNTTPNTTPPSYPIPIPIKTGELLRLFLERGLKCYVKHAEVNAFGEQDAAYLARILDYHQKRGADVTRESWDSWMEKKRKDSQ